MNEIISMRKKIAADKWKHFWVGIPLGILLQVICFYYASFTLTAVVAAFVMLVLVCYGFELFSLLTKLGHHDFIDAIAGILGGVIGMAIVVFFKFLEVF